MNNSTKYLLNINCTDQQQDLYYIDYIRPCKRGYAGVVFCFIKIIILAR